MVLPVALPVIMAGATVFAAKKVYDAFFVNDEAMDVNTHAKITLEVAESGLTVAREATSETLGKLGKTRLEVWGHPMARFHELYSRLENVDPEATKVALGDEQLAVIRKRSGQARECTQEKNVETDHNIFRPNSSCLPNNLALDSIIALGGIFFPATARTRLAEAEENLAWAEKTDDKMETAANKLWDIQAVASSFRDLLAELHPRMNLALDGLEEAVKAEGVDCRQYSPEAKRPLYLVLQFAQVMVPMLETPIITGDGDLYPGHEQVLGAGRELLALEERDEIP